MRSSIGDLDESARSTRRPALVQRGVERLGLASRPREAVEDRAPAGVRPPEPGEEDAGRSGRPDELRRAACIASTSRPSSLPRATAARSRSPEARTGTPSARARIGAWVPLPAPGAPRQDATVIAPTQPRLADEPFVVAHHELRLDLLHRLDDDARRRSGGPCRRCARPDQRRDEHGRRGPGATATMPRNSAPASVIRLTTRAR